MVVAEPLDGADVDLKVDGRVAHAGRSSRGGGHMRCSFTTPARDIFFRVFYSLKLLSLF